MHLLSLVPGLLVGVLYAVQYGNPIFLVAMLLTAVATLSTRRAMRPVGEVEIDSQGEIRIDGRVLSHFPMLWSANQRDKVLKLLVAPTASDVTVATKQLEGEYAQKGVLPLGVTRSLQPVTVQLDKGQPHLLIVGPTGSGKSVLIRGLAQHCNQIIDIDFKGGGNLSHLPALMRLNNLESAPESFWSHLNVLLDEREAGYSREFPPLQVFVDELAATLNSSSVAAKTIERIATRGRSASVFLVAANQSTSGVSRTIILNCQHRVLLGMVDPIDRTQLGAKSTTSTCPPSNDFLIGEYLHNGSQAEFLFEKPSASVDALLPPTNRIENPLAL